MVHYYLDCYDRKIDCDLTGVKLTTREETDDHNNQSEINLNFTWRTDFSEWIIKPDDPDSTLVLVTRFNASTTNFSFGVSRMQFRCEDELEAVMDFELRSVLDDCYMRTSMAGLVRDEAPTRLDNNIPAEGRVLNLYFDVLVDNQHIDFADIDDEECYLMIPAEDSSIMSLKRVAVDSDRNISCSICLEDLSGDNDFEEALSMLCSHVYHADCIKKWLCSHVYHADCIKKWLSISHYCPLCRFEMPTTNQINRYMDG